MRRIFRHIILATLMFAISPIFVFASPEIVLQNASLKIRMDAESGRFSLQTLAGRIDETNDSNKPILESGSWPSTSFVCLRINGRNYLPGRLPGRVLFSGITNDTIRFVWRVRQAVFQMNLHLFEGPSVSPVAVIRLSVSNIGPGRQETGLFLCLDTADQTYVTSDLSSVIRETNLPSPSYWYGADSLPNPSLLVKYSVPDRSARVQFGVWDWFDRDPFGERTLRTPSFQSAHPFHPGRDEAVGLFWKENISQGASVFHEVIVSLISARPAPENLVITECVKAAPETVCFSIRNTFIREISGLSVLFSSDAEDFIVFSNPEQTIRPLPPSGGLEVSSAWVPNANMDKEVEFNFSVISPFPSTVSVKRRITTSPPNLSLRVESFTDRPPLPASIRSGFTNALGRKDFFIDIADNEGRTVFREALGAVTATNGLWDWQWQGGDAEGKPVPVGTFYFCSLSFSNQAGVVFRSPKDIIILDPAPEISETNIVFSFPDINFDYNSSSLKPFASKILNYIGKRMTRATFTHVFIIGHTDDTGAEDHNLTLSKERARVIFEYLTGAFPFNPELFTVTGAGSSQPRAENSTEAGRRKNRRVEIILEK